MKTKYILLLFLLFSLTSCNLNPIEPGNEIEVSEKTAQLLKAQNDFGFELFRKVYSSEIEQDNIMVSPLSVSLALAMTYNGARGSTKTAMEKTLKVYGLTPDEINTSYRDLVKALKSIDPKVLLEIANSIYYRNSFQVENNFVVTNKNYYDAQVSALDFNSPEALKTINNWVAEKTHDKITSILKEIKPEHVMFLLNAVYFKGIWEKEFNVKNTEELPFYLENGNTLLVQTMQRNDTLPYMSNEIFSAIKLSYGKGNFNICIFLPQPDKGLNDIVGELNKTNWANWMSSYQNTENVIIHLPRLKYAYEIKLNNVLSDMGMGIAFTGAADLTGINRDGGLYIDYVRHKTFVEVNEEGTEAAAVTVVAIGKTSAGPKYIPFYLNKPFLFAITEKDTGAILFMGTVKNPLETQQQ